MNTTLKLPSTDEMYRALVDRNAEYEGIFFVGVKTTGVFCRPTCPSRKPRRDNVQFFATTRDALSGGFRPCRRCRPLHAAGDPPGWLEPLLERVDREPQRRWTDRDLSVMQLEPTRVRRWFKANHGMTFQAYSRARRLGLALHQLHGSQTAALDAAWDHGFESLSGFREAFTQWFGHSPAQARSSDSTISVHRLLTPLGPMIAAATSRGVCLLEFCDRRMLETQFQRLRTLFDRPFVLGPRPQLEQLESELAEYFSGGRHEFSVPLDLEGTPFQLKVWEQLRGIRYGQTISYESLARAIGLRNGQRAVGRANGDNRIAIVVPCHRVIRSNGELCGYGGGVWRKQWLLDHERSHAS
jgi:AraC family transcriptional regulator of adaptative response/methylated-DNA-[protein]-cysteine methyltransferase